MKYAVHRHRHRILFAFFMLLLAAGVVFGWRTFIGKGGEVASVDDSNSGPITGRPSPKSVSARTLIFGDIYPGGEVDDMARSSSRRFEYPFKSLESLGRQDYEAWIGSLDCPLTDASVPTAEQNLGKRNCAPEYATEMKEWFNVLALANEFTDDQEASGFAKTKEVLESAQIQYVGNPDQSKYDDMCEIVNLPARYTLNDGSFKEATMPLALCSVDLSSVIPGDLALDEVREYSKILPTWIYAHAGVETDAAIQALEQSTYRSFIDAGASVVISSQSNVAERIEAYKGKLIVYSLNDLIGMKSDGTLAFGLGIEISAQLDQSVLLWTRLSPDCAKFDDSCIETGAYQGLSLPKYSYKFTTVAFATDDNYAVTRATTNENRRLQDSLAWETVIASLVY